MDTAGIWDPLPGYFNTASYGLPPLASIEAMHTVLADWRVGRTSFERWESSVIASRECFARLVNVPTSDVAIGAAVSEQFGLVATALPDRAKVLVPEGEFTSVVFPWAVHEDRGVEVIVAPVAKLAEAVDASTTLVAFSLVQSASGEVAPFDDILASARHHGALIAVDGTQSCGWLPFDASGVDALATHTYKWMMSPRGASLLVLAPELRERMRPLAAGWFAGDNPHTSYYGLPLRLASDARRFDTSPAWFSWVGAQPALETIEQIGVENIRDHNVRLANRLRQGLGLETSDSAILSVEIDDAQQKLDRAGIRASVRAGRIRFSCHVYTTDHDVDEALTALTTR
jgi:selenocysteine lyase/cysteine desulfurase